MNSKEIYEILEKEWDKGTIKCITPYKEWVATSECHANEGYYLYGVKVYFKAGNGQPIFYEIKG